MLRCVCVRERKLVTARRYVYVCVVCSTETLIKDIERHFAPVARR